MKYLQLQLDFLLSKVMVMVIVISIAIIHGAMIYSSGILEGNTYLDAYKAMYQLEYLNESFVVSEFVLVFMAIFLGMHLANHHNHALMIYTIHSKHTKRQFVYARILSGVMILTMLWLVFIVSNAVFIEVLTPFSVNLHEYYQHLGLLYLEVIEYFLMTIFLMLLFNHMMMGLLSFLLFWVMEILSSTSQDSVSDILSLFVINVNGYQNCEKNVIISVCLYVFLLISYIIFIVKKDC